MNIFEATKLEFRRKILVLAGAKIDVTEQQSGLNVGFVKMKAFKLKEDIKLFTDSSQTQPLLNIKARQVIDFGATYDVSDPQNDQIMFSLQRKGLRSLFVRDKWRVLDPQGNEYAYAEETGSYALLRRYLVWIPYFGEILDTVFFFIKIDYAVYLTASGDTERAATITRQKNPFVIKFQTDTTNGALQIDNRITVALAMMLTVVEVNKN